jgi:hypothetical protein
MKQVVSILLLLVAVVNGRGPLFSLTANPRDENGQPVGTARRLVRVLRGHQEGTQAVVEAANDGEGEGGGRGRFNDNQMQDAISVLNTVRDANGRCSWLDKKEYDSHPIAGVLTQNNLIRYYQSVNGRLVHHSSGLIVAQSC